MKLCKRVTAVLLAGLMICLCTACGAEPQDQVYTEGSLQITLTDEFSKEDLSSQGYDWAYSTKKAVVMSVTESSDELEAAGLTVTSAASYADICVRANTYASGAQVMTAVDYPYCEYTATLDGESYSYYSTFYQNNDEYTVISFCCLTSDYTEMKPYFETWASSVTFQ